MKLSRVSIYVEIKERRMQNFNPFFYDSRFENFHFSDTSFNSVTIHFTKKATNSFNIASNIYFFLSFLTNDIFNIQNNNFKLMTRCMYLFFQLAFQKYVIPSIYIFKRFLNILHLSQNTLFGSRAWHRRIKENLLISYI